MERKLTFSWGKGNNLVLKVFINDPFVCFDSHLSYRLIRLVFLDGLVSKNIDM